MPLPDSEQYQQTEDVIARFRAQFPILDGDAVSSVHLAGGGWVILVVLFEDVNLPATFEGLRVKKFI